MQLCQVTELPFSFSNKIVPNSTAEQGTRGPSEVFERAVGSSISIPYQDLSLIPLEIIFLTSHRLQMHKMLMKFTHCEFFLRLRPPVKEIRNG